MVIQSLARGVGGDLQTLRIETSLLTSGPCSLIVSAEGELTEFQIHYSILTSD